MASVRYIRKSANDGAAFVVDHLWRRCVSEPPMDENCAGIRRGGTQAPGDEGCTAEDGRGGAQAPGENQVEAMKSLADLGNPSSSE